MVRQLEHFPNLVTMLTRETSRGTVLGRDEAIDMETALAAYTEFGAYVNKAETRLGRLAPGMAADIAVYSRDLFSASPDEILHDTRCDLTISGGAVVHEAG